MLADAVHQRLVSILPAFEAYWQSPGNVFGNNSQDPTLCGVFSACSHYVREHVSELSPGQASELGAFVTECMSEPGTTLDEAAATCFLENLAHEPGAELLMPHLSGHALRFLRDQGAA
jgi:hypothetical protein